MDYILGYFFNDQYKLMKAMNLISNLEKKIYPYLDSSAEHLNRRFSQFRPYFIFYYLKRKNFNTQL